MNSPNTNKILKKCEELEQLTQNDQEKNFLKTASIFFYELAECDMIYGEGVRIDFIKKSIHELESVLS